MRILETKECRNWIFKCTYERTHFDRSVDPISTGRGGADYANRNNIRPYGSSGLPTAMPTVITYETAATDMTPTVCLILAKSTKILVLYFDFE